MRLHTYLSADEIIACLNRARLNDRVAFDVRVVTVDVYKSRTHHHAFEVNIGVPGDTYMPLPKGAYNKDGTTVDQRKRTAGIGPSRKVWSATWSEWGWFLAELFSADPAARVVDRNRGDFNGRDEFHARTFHEFTHEPDHAPGRCLGSDCTDPYHASEAGRL